VRHGCGDGLKYQTGRQFVVVVVVVVCVCVRERERERERTKNGKRGSGARKQDYRR